MLFQRGFDITQAEQTPGPVPVISSSGITSYHDQAKASGPGVVMGRKGTLGSVHYSEADYWPHDTTLWSKDLRGNDARFVYFYLHTIDFKRFNVGNSNPTLNRNHIHDLPVMIPPLDTQRRIVDILAPYDELIENNRRRTALLEESARHLYREWFVRLRFPGKEHTRATSGVPDGWEERPLAKCAKFLSGGTPSKAKHDFWEGDIPWVSSGELTAFRLHKTSLNITAEAVEAGSRLVPAETILAVVRGMSLAKEFRIALTSVPMAFNQDLKAIVAEPDVDPLLLFHSLDSQRDRIRDRAGEASHGTKKLDSSVLSDVSVMVPPLPLQQLFRDYVRPLHAQWDNLQQQNFRLRAASDLLLPRLMNGEIAV